jgi:hypothetical protein
MTFIIRLSLAALAALTVFGSTTAAACGCFEG